MPFSNLKTDELHYIIAHVFLPPKLPQESDQSSTKDYALCHETYQHAEMYRSLLPADHWTRWTYILRMLWNIFNCHQFDTLSAERIHLSMTDMVPGDVRALLIRAQNAAVIMRKSENQTVFESFEVTPPAADVMKAAGKLLCSYPGPAIAVPRETVSNPHFCKQLTSFLEQMNVDVLDSAATTTKAGSTVVEERDSAHPRYITQLLTGILRGMGQIAEVTRIRKRIADDVLWKNARTPWRRSSLWLVIRVALQTTLYVETNGQGHREYKEFMVFLMAGILRRALQNDLPSDLIFCMRAKMSRRLHKLGSTPPQFVLQAVREAGDEAERILRARWSMVQREQATSPPWTPENLNTLQDTHLTLRNSRDYLSRAMRQVHSKGIAYTFQPTQSPRLRDTYHDFRVFDETRLMRAFSDDSPAALADFETSVQNHLDDWVSQNLYAESTCVTISACITQYTDAARKLYVSDPEDESLMLLTIFDLWVALDKVAVAQCPLLREYSPEVPLHLLEPLLIRKSKPLHRLALIQKYLHERHRCAKSGASIFKGKGDVTSFAVRYFETSREHLFLKRRIESDAEVARLEKRVELQLKNNQHKKLVDEARDLNHAYRVNARGKSLHERHCHKCSVESQAHHLQIEPHEWPLPDNELEAKAVVFELQCPRVFGVWRATTYQVLFDICQDLPASSTNPAVRLQSYHGLQKYFSSSHVSRVTYASKTKSFLSSHYRTTQIPASESSVLVNNGLQFRLFDDIQKRWLTDSFNDCSVVRYCTLRLPAHGAYKGLQYAIAFTTHTSNEILANQSECPKDLSLHEYIAFGTLRSGSLLQWLNIARELPARSLSFHREEVHTLLMQAAWQIGPLTQGSATGWHAEWHAEINSPGFGSVLLAELEALLLSVEANWLEVISARTIIMLTSRLLTSARDRTVIERAYRLLRKARNVTVQWMRQLVERLQDSEDDNNVLNFQLRVCEMAVTCRGTYDVDPIHLSHLLTSAEDVAILIECAIQVFDNTPPTLKNVPPYFLQLLARDRRLSHSLECVIAQQCEIHREGLDRAISAIWPAYRPGTPWQLLPRPNDRWITSMTGIEAGKASQQVHLNLLTGRLLVNGRPLGRLPQIIVKHPTYTRIFGQKVLDVIPADMSGMDFMTRSLVCGYQVFFAMRDEDKTLIIRAKRGSKTLELIPHGNLTGDLPTFFVCNYAHWLDIPHGGDQSNCEIELRPMQSLWESSPKNWRIHFSIAGYSEMRKEPSFLLLDIHKPTFSMISACLKPLERAEYLTVTCSTEGDSLSVDLPRYMLSFFLNSEGQLESKNLPRMVIDSNQSTGTMFGLSSQLVLRPKDPLAIDLPRSRRVIIPYGDVRFQTQGDHVRVEVLTGSQNRVRYHDYKIDTDLGCLVGNVSLVSKLYKLYLHAVSSYCLPDPLTGRTGTEEALSELGSAGCLSFQKLGVDEVELLQKIGAVTPKRVFYPANLEVMQTVDWSVLGPIAQHHGFFEITRSILEYAKILQIFHENDDPIHPSSDNARSHHLRNRAAFRNKSFYPHEYGGPLALEDADFEYSSRDLLVDHNADKEGNVFNVSAMVQSWPAKLNTSRELFTIMQAWNNLSGPKDDLTLAYTRDWLTPDLPAIWISLYNLCRKGVGDQRRFELTFTLSAMSYSSAECRDLVPTILAFAIIPQFGTLPPPSWSSYDLSQGFEPRKDQLLQMIRSSALPLEDTPAINITIHAGETRAAFDRRRLSYYNHLLDSQAEELVVDLINQWPCREPHSPHKPRLPFNIPAVMNLARPRFQHWYQNRNIRDHICQVQISLDWFHLRAAATTERRWLRYIFSPCLKPHSSPSSAVIFDWLLERDAPKIRSPSSTTLATPETFRQRQGADTRELQSLIAEFESDSSALRRRYGADLTESRSTLDNQTFSTFPDLIPYSMEALLYNRDQCKRYLVDIFDTIFQSLSPSSPTESAIFTAGLWPRLTTKSLLGKLASTSNSNLTREWTSVLTSLARASLRYQRSQRLIDSALRQSHEEFFKELENTKFDETLVMQNPDALLIQVESNFLVRPLQSCVAKEMIAPASGKNAILQLNMGEGKSSVIAPLVAAVLADGQRLARVVVLKPLARQMFQLLVERLSGLTNRRIFYMPFSRNVKVDAQHTQHIQALYEVCTRERGVLVVQPEHILSFKLIGIDRLLCSTSSETRRVADTLLASQRWLNTKSRDILDESDEILHVQYQLVYTVGQQQPLEGHPDRWTTMQQIFALVKKYAPQIQQQHPRGMEVHPCRHGSFGLIRILEVEAGTMLVSFVTQDIAQDGLSNFTFGLLPRNVRDAALRFITSMNVPSEEASLLEEHCKGTASWNGLLLLRGLLVHGVLAYVLQERRWRVDYGLDPSRSLLAVPYRAKDVPALRAEFGHPDVAIALTCLSYYYGGLTEKQLLLCFELLFHLDNPNLEYEKWVRNDDTIPSWLRELVGVNTEDLDQRKRYLIPLFQYNHIVIDFYLSRVVFPKEAKEFPQKLATSGWDVAESKHHVTTGFSGTNDNRYLLPTSISQCDPVGQLSTNAKVLTYLLRPENDYYLCAQSQTGEPASAEHFLELIVEQRPEIRVLLDVGAQMLEFKNGELVEHWLSLMPEMPAAVFFSDTDELVVLTRDGTVEPFISSPFNQQLNKCLVYLDDAHTRGTDLKLPRGTRAAVSVGPKVTKDRLLQSCMRMRKLGHGQSVMLFAPPEIDRRIHELAGKSPSERITILDILRWAMLETCADIQHHVPHWAEQGIDYEKRKTAWLEFSSSGDSSVELIKSSWLQSEARTLQEMYGLPPTITRRSRDSGSSHAAFSIPVMHERFEMLGILSLADPRMDEEQEREVSHEIERERQVERPPKAVPARHHVHLHVRQFVETGFLPLISPAFVSLFAPLEHITPAFRLGGPCVWTSQLFATKDFATTIQSSFNSATDYMRPVNWIISSPSGILVVLSPYEVDLLLPIIRKSKAVHLHMYTPRVTKAMKCFDDLQFYCIPSLPRSWVPPTLEIPQLNLWAGQLYLADYEAYLRLCKFLGVYTKEYRGTDIQLDGFIKPEHRCGMTATSLCRFAESPLPFLKELLGLRRKGMGYLSSHLGQILSARLLTDEDFS